MYLKTPNATGQRTFSRCAAPFFLEIRQYSCEKMSCSAQKFPAAGHIGSFQIHPRASMTWFVEANCIYKSSHSGVSPEVNKTPPCKILAFLLWFEAKKLEWLLCNFLTFSHLAHSLRAWQPSCFSYIILYIQNTGHFIFLRQCFGILLQISDFFLLQMPTRFPDIFTDIFLIFLYITVLSS